MSDDTKIVDQNPAVNPTAMGIQVPVQRTGNMLKEKAPIGPNLSEFVRPAGPEVSPKLSIEEKESGVEIKSNKPNLTFEHKELGIDHAGSDVTVPSSLSGKVKLPMSEEEIENQLKTGQDDDSGKWLAWLFKKVIQWGFKNE